MAKLRKMLGDIQSPSVIALMRLIETQSKETLARWAIEYAMTNCRTLYKDTYPTDTRLSDAVTAVEGYLGGEIKLKDIKPYLREAATAAKEAEGVVEQAAARAIATACAVVQTPTNALGYTFYCVAAMVYARVGLEQEQEVYNTQAEEGFKEVLKSLEVIAVQDESNPVRVNWNC